MEISKELIGRARELQPIIAGRAPETERNRAPLDETIKDLCDAGFMQILTPKRFGGHELHLDTMVEVARIISTACPSTGWVLSFYMGHNWLHAVFPEKSQEEVFATRSFALSSGQIAPTAKAVRVAGGFELTGRQAWSSGVVHAEWIFFTGLVAEEGVPPHPWMFCVPRADVQVIDTWFIAGMQGTGSRDVAADKVFVPQHRAYSFIALLQGTHPGRSIHANPLYSLPVITALSFEAMPVLSGALRGAADIFVQITRDRIASYTGTSVAAKPTAQMRAGRAFAMAEALDAMVDDSIDLVMGLGSRLPTPHERARIRVRCALMNKMACESVNDIIHGAGGDAFRDKSPLQRFFRDLNVLRSHAGIDIDAASELYGKVLLDIDTAGLMV